MEPITAWPVIGCRRSWTIVCWPHWGCRTCALRCAIPEELGGDYVPKASGTLIALYFIACADLRCCAVNPQMLWWGIEETLVELLTWHEPAGNSEGNRVGTFCATIMGVEYGPDEMPA